MAIIKTIKEAPYKDGLRWTRPDDFVSDRIKESDDWWKKYMDYWATMAMGQYSRNRSSPYMNNYKLLKGYLSKEDFYNEEQSKLVDEAIDLIDTLEQDLELPSYVKHYPILNPPINTMVGEMSKRPDNAFVKAFDDDSQSEQLQAMTDMFQQYMEQLIRQKVTVKLQAQGQDTSDLEAMEEQIEQVTAEQMAQYRTSFTTIAERWGSKMLENLKMAFNIKEKSEKSFRDLLVAAREYLHIQEDGSKIGFDIIKENPLHIWKLATAGKEYTRDAYAAGTIKIMELSEILATYPFLTEEEITKLRERANQIYDVPGKPFGIPIDYVSPLLQKNPTTGVASINYHVYDPAIEQKRREIELSMMENELDADMGMSSSVNAYGDKFVVCKAYWKSKKKIGKLSYYDEDGMVQTTIVDETYKKIPEEIDVEWGWINQWYEGLKIGDEIYYVNPFKLLPYCPIIGVIHESENSAPASLVDLMKPYQMIFNVCMNQLWRLLEKEKGPLFLTDIRQVPTPKDGDNQDAIDMWMLEAQESGIIFLDNSPDNTKAPSNFNQHSVQDMSLTAQFQSRLNIAEQIKNECWELVGVNRQRQGQVQATETATATNTALSQSYAQTEIYFVQHEYLWNQVYQAMLDAAMHIEVQKPESTLSYINGEGENVFLKVNREDLLLRDLQVFVTSRGKDQALFTQLQGLAQPLLQNGAGFDVIYELYNTTSVRQMADVIKSFQKKKEAMEQSQQQQAQQQLEQQQTQFEAQIQEEQRQHQMDAEREDYNKEADRINKKELEVIKALGYGKQQGEDLDGNGVPDLYQMETLNQKSQQLQQQHTQALQSQQLAQQQHLSDNALKQANIQLQKDKMKLQEKDMEMKDRQHKEKLTVQKMAKKTPPKKK